MMLKLVRRISLRNFLLVVLVIGAAGGLIGRYLTWDAGPRIWRVQLEGYHRAFVWFGSSRNDARPGVVVLVPTTANVSAEIEGFGTVHGRSPSDPVDDLLRFELSGRVLFNGKPIDVSPAQRVWIFTAERKVLPVRGDESFLDDIRFSMLKQIDKTAEYRNVWKPLLDAEWAKLNRARQREINRDE